MQVQQPKMISFLLPIFPEVWNKLGDDFHIGLTREVSAAERRYGSPSVDMDPHHGFTLRITSGGYLLHEMIVYFDLDNEYFLFWVSPGDVVRFYVDDPDTPDSMGLEDRYLVPIPKLEEAVRCALVEHVITSWRQKGTPRGIITEFETVVEDIVGAATEEMLRILRSAPELEHHFELEDENPGSGRHNDVDGTGTPREVE